MAKAFSKILASLDKHPGTTLLLTVAVVVILLSIGDSCVQRARSQAECACFQVCGTDLDPEQGMACISACKEE